MINNTDKIYTMGCMDNCIVGDRKVDFGLDDTAKDDTNLENMWKDFENKMKDIF